MRAGRNRGDPGVPISVSNTLAVSFNLPTSNSLITSPRWVHKRKAGRRSPTSPRSPHSVDQAKNCGTAVLSPAHVAGHRSLKPCVLNCEASEGAEVVVRMGTVDQHRIEFSTSSLLLCRLSRGVLGEGLLQHGCCTKTCRWLV